MFFNVLKKLQSVVNIIVYSIEFFIVYVFDIDFIMILFKFCLLFDLFRLYNQFNINCFFQLYIYFFIIYI